MKRTILFSLSALTLALTAAPTLAEEVAAARKISTNNIVAITPFNLVSRSYQGYFTDRGIPSNGAFVSATQTGRVTAKDLVEAAIAHRRLSPETKNDRAYLNIIESHLKIFESSDSK